MRTIAPDERVVARLEVEQARRRGGAGSTRTCVGRLRADVVERDQLVVRVDGARGAAARGDLAEEAGHRLAYSVHRPPARARLAAAARLRARSGQLRASPRPLQELAGRGGDGQRGDLVRVGPSRNRSGSLGTGGREPGAVALERDAPERDGVARAHRERRRARRAGRGAPRARARGRGGPATRASVCGTSHIRPSSRPSGRRTSRTRPSLSTSAAATVTSTGARRARPSGSSSTRPSARARQCRRSGQAGAAGLARRADGGAELHQRLVPVARAARGRAAPRRGCSTAPSLPVLGAAQGEQPREHAPHVAVDDGQRLAVRDREDGARGVEADPGHGQRGLERPREAARRGARPRAARRGAGCARGGSSRGPTRRRARPPRGAAARACEGGEARQEAPRSRARRPSPWSAGASPPRPRRGRGPSSGARAGRGGCARTRRGARAGRPLRPCRESTRGPG